VDCILNFQRSTWTCDIINLSLGGPQFSPLEQATIARVIQSGAIVVAAAGNQSSQQVDYPAAYQGVIAVGSIDRFNNVPPYSNSGNDLDILAPGGDCLDSLCTGGVTSLSSEGFLSENGFDSRVSTWKRLSGTSMATAHVSGLLSLLKSHLPSADTHHILGWLHSGKLTNKTTNTENNFSVTTGYGMINPEKILEIIDTTSGLQSGLWSDQSTLYLEPKESKEITIIQRSSDASVPNLSALSWSYNADLIQLTETENGAVIRLLNDLHSPIMVGVHSMDGANHSIKVIQKHPSQLPTYVNHLYVDIKDRLSGLRSILQKNTWVVKVPDEINQALIQASTDLDYDGVYCEAGEFCALTDQNNDEIKQDIYGEIHR